MLNLVGKRMRKLNDSKKSADSIKTSLIKTRMQFFNMFNKLGALFVVMNTTSARFKNCMVVNSRNNEMHNQYTVLQNFKKANKILSYTNWIKCIKESIFFKRTVHVSR